MTPSASPAELLHVALQAAAAGAAVLEARSEGELQAENKSSDSDWVTAFDTAAERAVRDVIWRSRPHDAITGEEYGTTVPEGQPSGIRWSIDPLDGTTNFIRNIVYYCTSVAAVDHDGDWLAGVVHAPALDRVYWASRGQGAWVRERGTVRQLHGPVAGRAGTIVGSGFTYNPAQRSQQLGELGELLAGHGDLRRIGSAALDLCMVADGTLDAYVERALNEHDWAAGALIAEEAGVAVLRPDLSSVLDAGPDEAERFSAFTAAGPQPVLDLAKQLESRA
ncbi:myo-inositol-1(or 4)-monophosphatase [Arthrobacter subterraneus]|jgi:myo-inositol-1(or 4)-monophosphatase|uniref:Myo-inositol-1(Or 4)-monophosphatase n=1 Tax=Arthrobacter subterraneus TaxID=335973 RepID=A0A1G8GL13_9MICC|nr:inositol monophosphatase family protein [Arthrobacter subterraneus]SDH95069.1 myo-inositol-1(or 4)-monophosphatase [Arthrobacter subterraneus]